MTNERPFHEQYEVRASNGNQVLEDLTAARARIAELESVLREQRLLTVNFRDETYELKQEIAELEDWQRRAIEDMKRLRMCRSADAYWAQRFYNLIQEAAR